MAVLVGIITSFGLIPAGAGERGQHEAFPHLKYFEIAPDYIYLWYEPGATTLLLDRFPTNQADPEAPVAILETRLGDSAGTVCRVEFSWGPSEDPHFVILGKTAGGGEWREIGLIPANELTIPASGSVYSWGASNEMFAKSRKFVMDDGMLVELEQPFYRVDVQTKTKKPITLVSEPGGESSVAALGAGADVHVLINRGAHYLISTPFGLTGWVTIEDCLEPESPIEGIYFRGD